MRKKRTRTARRTYSDEALPRPTVLSLLGHILKSAFAGEVLWITAPGGALLAYLYVNRVASPNLLVILLMAVVVLAFLRGCREWQKDLVVYRKSLLHLGNRHPG